MTRTAISFANAFSLSLFHFLSAFLLCQTLQHPFNILDIEAATTTTMERQTQMKHKQCKTNERNDTTKRTCLRFEEQKNETQSFQPAETCEKILLFCWRVETCLNLLDCAENFRTTVVELYDLFGENVDRSLHAKSQLITIVNWLVDTIQIQFGIWQHSVLVPTKSRRPVDREMIKKQLVVKKHVFRAQKTIFKAFLCDSLLVFATFVVDFWPHTLTKASQNAITLSKMCLKTPFCVKMTTWTSHITFLCVEHSGKWTEWWTKVEHEMFFDVLVRTCWLIPRESVGDEASAPFVAWMCTCGVRTMFGDVSASV